jgi:hypothetical protein
MCLIKFKKKHQEGQTLRFKLDKSIVEEACVLVYIYKYNF